MIILVILIIFIILVRFEVIVLDKNVKYSSFQISRFSDITTQKYTPGGIPKVIYKTSWQSRDKMPEKMIEVLQKTINLNPEYQVFYFDHSERESFMKNECSQEVYDCYKKLIPGAYQADLFRLCILYKYGGCYSDIGHELFVPLDKILEDYNIVLVKDTPVREYYGIHNSFMCTVPEHPFFKACIDKCCENIKNGVYGEDSLDVTGPRMIGKVYNCFFEDKCYHSNIIKIGDNEYECNRCKIKVLSLKFLPLKFERTYYIFDNDTPIIKTKFEGYNYIMYGSVKKDSYMTLWKKKNIYK
jgi:hypothetical protein